MVEGRSVGLYVPLCKFNTWENGARWTSWRRLGPIQTRKLGRRSASLTELLNAALAA